METSNPRVFGRLLPQYLGRTVFLIGDASAMKFDERRNTVIRASDGVDVTLILPPGERIDSPVVQVEGKVTSNNTIEVQRLQPVSANFDMSNYHKSLELMHSGKFSHLFT